MEETDIVSWNSIINSYVQCGLVEESVNLYIEMLRDGLKPDHFTLASVLRACSSLSRVLHLTDQVHAHVVKNRLDSDTFVSTTLVDSYSRRGRMEQAESLFLNKDEFDFGSWNAMMFGYINNGNSHKAWELFTIMHNNCEKPDEITLATMAKACAFIVSLKLGRQVHSYAMKLGVDSDLYLSSSLVDMYIKCGDVVDAYQIFAIPFPDDVVWISMISGCVENGDEDRALVIYHKMRHYSCLVDALGRGGRVKEAEKLITSMPFEASASMYRALLGACRLQRDMETGKRVATKLLELEPFDSSAYVLLSNIYAASNQWSKVADARTEMTSKNVKKDPGCSWKISKLKHMPLLWMIDHIQKMRKYMKR